MAAQLSANNLESLEAHLASNLYLSTEALPNQEDARVLGELSGTPDRLKFPNVFAWWWNLCLFAPAARELWGKSGESQGKVEGEQKKVGGKPVGKPAPKVAQADEDDEDDDDLDLFGGVTEEEKAALEEENKKKAATVKKVVVGKSRVSFDVKGYEVGQDFDSLAKKIQEALQKDGLVWQDSYEIVPIGYGINSLRLTMIIEDDKISTDDIFEFIQEKYDEEVQSCDIHEFNKV